MKLRLSSQPAIPNFWLVVQTLLLVMGTGIIGFSPFGQSVAQDFDYQALMPDRIAVPDSFQAQLVYAIPQDKGSWVALASEKEGRMIASDQYGNLYRISPPPISQDQADLHPETKVERIEIDLGFAQGLLYAFDSLYVVAHASQPFKRPAGLYRVRDTNNDDQYDSVELLREFQGGGEHGPHAVILSPDGKSLYICAGNHTKIPVPETSRMVQRWDEDQLLTRFPDANGHAVGYMAPGGWICKTDPDGKSFEMISAGFRNQYDIAFDPNGELFTYDADMEWDIGLPWYRATRVCHVTSASEFGWRHGSGKWPEYYPDSLPGIYDVGPGSPTGVVFGTGAKFPGDFQNGLYIADWSYGIIYRVTMEPMGSSYRAVAERFCSAPALPVTDLIINPADGAMYFLIGGRRIRSALYRVVYRGPETTEPVAYPQLTAAAKTRKQLEQWHFANANPDWDLVWQCLRSQDRFLRFAARVVLEHQSHETWETRLESESNPTAIIEGCIALARTGDNSLLSLVTEKLSGLDWRAIDVNQKLMLCRAWGLSLIRLAGMGVDQQHHQDGTPNRKTLQAVMDLEVFFPSSDSRINRELARLLIAAGSPTITAKVVDSLKSANTQEEQTILAATLVDATSGWTIELRANYFQWFLDAARIRGGHSLSGYIRNIRNAALEKLSDLEKADLAEVLSKEVEVVDPYAELAARPFVKNWSLDELKELESADFSAADLVNGKNLFAVAACFKCHRMAGEGGIVGPDLTPAGRRFSTIDLLETIVDPSKEVSDQYQATIFLLSDGRMVTGRVANLSGNNYMIQEDLINPGQLTSISVDDIDEMKPASTSLMPAGLLDNLNKEEIIDLLAYMKSVSEEAMGESTAAAESAESNVSATSENAKTFSANSQSDN